MSNNKQDWVIWAPSQQMIRAELIVRQIIEDAQRNALGLDSIALQGRMVEIIAASLETIEAAVTERKAPLTPVARAAANAIKQHVKQTIQARSEKSPLAVLAEAAEEKLPPIKRRKAGRPPWTEAQKAAARAKAAAKRAKRAKKNAVAAPVENGGQPQQA